MALYRRDFIKKTTLASSACLLPMASLPALHKTSTKKAKEGLRVFLFSKHLQFLNYNDMAEATAEMGFQGLDLTVRPRGHVLPARVEDDLPKAVEPMKKFGLAPILMTTNITDATDVESIKVLKTASALKFTHYRMGWLSYP